MPKYMGMKLRFKEQRPSFHTADHGKVQARLLLLKKFSSSERPSSICGSSGRSAAVRCLASAIAKDGRKSWMRSTPIMHWCCQRMSNSSLLLRSYYILLWINDFSYHRNTAKCTFLKVSTLRCKNLPKFTKREKLHDYWILGWRKHPAVKVYRLYSLIGLPLHFL